MLNPNNHHAVNWDVCIMQHLITPTFMYYSFEFEVVVADDGGLFCPHNNYCCCGVHDFMPPSSRENKQKVCRNDCIRQNDAT